MNNLDRGTIIDIGLEPPDGQLFDSELFVDISSPMRRARYLGGKWLASYRNPRTRDAYRRALYEWFEFLEEHHVGDFITEPDRGVADVWTRQIEERGFQARTVYRRISILATFHRYLHEEGHRRDNPFARVTRPALPRESMREWMNAREANAFLAAAKQRGGYPYALCCLLVLNALRVSEATNANVEQLGQDGHVPWLIIIGKGNQPSKIALAPETQWAIAEALDGRTWGPLLLNRAGTRMQRDAAARIVRRAARAAGVTKHIVPHSCRHTGITIHYKAKKDPHSTQSFARHADIRTTMLYTHADVPLAAHGTFAVAAHLAGAD